MGEARTGGTGECHRVPALGAFTFSPPGNRPSISPPSSPPGAGLQVTLAASRPSPFFCASLREPRDVSPPPKQPSQQLSVSPLGHVYCARVMHIFVQLLLALSLLGGVLSAVVRQGHSPAVNGVVSRHCQKLNNLHHSRDATLATVREEPAGTAAALQARPQCSITQHSQSGRPDPAQPPRHPRVERMSPLRCPWASCGSYSEVAAAAKGLCSASLVA